MDDPHVPADEDERGQGCRHAVRRIGAGLAEHPSIGAREGEAGGAARAERGGGAEIAFRQAVDRDLARFHGTATVTDAARDRGNDAAAGFVEGFAAVDRVEVRALRSRRDGRRGSDRQRPSPGAQL